MINIIIGGDVCPVRRNLPLFKDGNAKDIFNDLLVEFENADLSVVNLECPLITNNTPMVKNGPVLGVDSVCINGLTKADIDIVNLANNHILDHGNEGLLNTLKVCSEAGIITVGAGNNLESASRIVVKEVKGVRIGILGIAENEFSIATNKSPGANSLDLISYVRNIKKNREYFDYLIVLAHAGLSYHPLPSPQLMDTCRFLAEMGADAIICQHSHCPGSYEQYDGAYIVYGQGNLIFDLGIKSDNPWNKGFLVKITITEKGKHEMNIIPYEQSCTKPGARRMLGGNEEKFLQEINNESLKLTDASCVEEEWIRLCNERKHTYYHDILLGFADCTLSDIINKSTHYAEHLFTKKHLLLLENIIRCESHREAIETILETRRKNITNE